MSQVVVYSSDYCPYCMRAKQLLQSKKVAFEEIKVDGKPAVRAEMAQKAGRTSVPQIWIGTQHIGGCDDLFALERAGKLDALLHV
ncbi:glutaredoxin 3 [Pseudomonas sp. MF6772]|jgi:glutaredoxin 3|uniref:Glutaredoxin n=1 Tax=Pseudomonas shahriarae TaxID=2745512 RepID=A0ABT5NA20_9PSED|nr:MULTISPECIES: glutaredoxin 3 [Pseudomonas]OAE17212.1 glutaredoxin [Pseudomonas brenneri]SUD42401.1 glutaredoxin 3 [Pseudomonas fluorescens]MBJ2241321.1 glutaredoxin 3 [Pseudomonas sp. MF6768]MBJ2266420.1 glutaredoxin 3 [Pseudomonas sp. MF6772]MBJ2289704.1 glutaredoxin 3 [Pseudomonas sp. MF5691]